jgi:integrase
MPPLQEANMDRLIDILNDDYGPLRGLKPKAHLQFRLSIEKFRDHLGRDPVIADLTGVTVQRFLSARKAKVSVATVVKDRTHLCALWNHLFRLRRVDVAPSAVLPPMRAPKRIPKAYKADEVSAIIRAALAYPGGVAGKPANLWHASLIRAAFETAERIGALLAVEWRDVDLDERVILLRAENRKGGYRDLLRPISSETAAWLKKLRRGSADKALVWEWDRDPNHIWYHLKAICKRAGVQARGYHGFRKSAASYLAAAGGLGEAATALGHHSPTTTATHYVDPTIAKPSRSYVDMLPRIELSDRASGEPDDSEAQAREAAMRVGHCRGKNLGEAGLPCPARGQQEELAAADGVPPALSAHYRSGFLSGWSAAQESAG